MVQNMSAELGTPIPPNTPHAVSVSLPTWRDNIDYEEGAVRVHSKLACGYPRFVIQPEIKKLAALCEQKFSKPTESSLLFPTPAVAERCRAFLKRYSVPGASVRIVEYKLTPPKDSPQAIIGPVALQIVLFPKELSSLAKQFWQHTGEGISSRLAEFCLFILRGNTSDLGLKKSFTRTPSKAMRSHYIPPSFHEESVEPDMPLYIEERYGRNLNVKFAENAKIAVRRRIAGLMTEQVVELENLMATNLVIEKQRTTEGDRGIIGVTEEDVYLFPCGMSAIFSAHRFLLEAFSARKFVCFGFPYTDTLKILQKFGTGCYFLGHGESADIARLEELLEEHQRNNDPLLALFCEFPSNPLLKSPDLKRLRSLANKYDFLIVVDETIGNFVNVRILEWADIVVSSLTKVFSGDSNVMGGSLVLNSKLPHYQRLKEAISRSYEDLLWPEDAIYLERNSRNFKDRIKVIDDNTEALCDFLKSHPKVSQVFYPKYITPDNYLACKSPSGGYGGLFSILFNSETAAAQFFDALPCSKGPSLGTNFTLSCPYTILAHYTELDWAKEYGVPKDLIRISVGLESKEELIANFEKALEAVFDT